ncbi:MAG TPA: ISAzo13 family transposase [Succinivibrionaceae bacterium]|nr:ISAzo13 family transposase [Succinivibrionaceae bacterium]
MGDIAIDSLVGKMMPLLDERTRRLFLGILADCLGRGGVTKLSNLTKVSRVTITQGQKESAELEINPQARPNSDENNRSRTEGGGRKKLDTKYPTIKEELEKLLDGNVIGNPENPLCWTTKSVRKLADELNKVGIKIHYTSIGGLLEEMGFSLQQNRKYVEAGDSSIDRDEQFEYINENAKQFINANQPVISVDTKKKELIGNYKNNGSEYRPKGEPLKVQDHDFGTLRAAPYGIYDIGNNEGFVNVGLSADTGAFAANSIKSWWENMGKERYPDAKTLMITADGGGSNGRRNRQWKKGLQEFSNVSGLEIKICHFPPGTSKWNKIEHRMFSYISKNWRGRPLETIEVVVNLIASTTTKQGLKIRCEIDQKEYEKGVKITEEELAKLNIIPNDWHGEWNYTIKPQKNN